MGPPSPQSAELHAERLRKRARNQRRVLSLSAASYAFDSLVLACYALLGDVPGTIVAGYAAAGAAQCLAFAFALRRPGVLAAHDYYLTAPQMAVATLIQLTFVWLAPQVGFVFLGVLFVVFGFGALSLSPRQAAVAWALTLAGSGAVLALLDHPPAIPLGTPAEKMLLWIVFGVTIGRSAGLGLLGSGLRVRLHRRNQELGATLARVNRLATIDPLTGVANRRSILERVADEVLHAQRSGETFSVAMLDLDRFKSVNDRFGHAVGDKVLAEFARAAQSAMRSNDPLGRVGGEEFLVLMPGSDAASALAAANRLRAAVAAVRWSELGDGLAVTTSAGVAQYRAGESLEQLLSRADAALYRAKAQGRDRAVNLEPG
jgi:diguanylate cyclase (GGDEF)-like protein